MLIGNRAGVCLNRRSINPMLPPTFQLIEHVNNVSIVMSPLWHGLGNIHGFVLDGNSYR